VINDVLLAQACTQLSSRARAVTALQFGPLVARRFDLTAIAEGFRRGEIARWLREELSERIDVPVIYKMSANNQDTANRLQAAFRVRQDNEGFKFPRDNEVENSTTLYVGSSHKIRDRLRQHLQRAPGGTYALNMGLWCPEDAGSVTVEAQVVLSDPAPYSVQDVEDALWITSRPILGKFGAK